MTAAPLLRPVATADAAEVEAVLALNERDVDLLAPMDAGRFEQLRGWADRFDVLEVDGRLAGFVVTFAPGTGYDSENYRYFGSRYGGRFYYLDRIVVSDEFRRRGLGRFVYDALEEVARPYGRMTLEVNVEPPNDGSLTFHRRRGYVEVGRRGEPGHIVGLMVKEL